MSSKEKKRFRVALIRIHNIAGIQEAEISPGALTLVEGKNASGKTSMIEACKLPFGKGHKATLLREGEKEGEVVYFLDDGGGQPYLQVRARITEKTTERQIGYAGEPAMPRPAEVLDRLRSEFTLFPTSFLTKKKDERLEMFLSAIPLRVEEEDLAAVLPLCSRAGMFDLGEHAFKLLGQIHDHLYDKRKALNSVISDKEKTVKTLRENLPAQALDGEAAAAELMAASAEHVEKNNSYRRESEKISDAMRIEFDSAKADFDTAVAEARAVMDETIGQARKRAEAAKEDVKVRADADLSLLERRIATAEAQSKTYTEMQSTRKLISDLSADAEKKQQESDRLSEAINKLLPDLRSAILDKVPVKGVSVRDGDIWVVQADGKTELPFDSINTAERIRIACELALIHAGPLKLVCMDGAEALDEDSLDLVRDIMEANGAQCIASRVTDSPTLEVTK